MRTPGRWKPLHRRREQPWRTRRIDQNRVLAQQSPIRLIELHKEIQEGFIDRFGGGHLDHAAITAQHRSELQVVEEKCPVDPGTAELVCRCQAHRQLVFLQAGGIHHCDIGTQRLIQRRMQGDFTRPSAGAHAEYVTAAPASNH